MPSSLQVLSVGGSIWQCSGDVAVDEPLLTSLAERSARERCVASLPPLQRPVADELPVRFSTDGCGKWIAAEYRMCVQDASRALPEDRRSVVLYARGGSFYAQRLESAGLELANGCRQAAFFHFQVS